MNLTLLRNGARGAALGVPGAARAAVVLGDGLPAYRHGIWTDGRVAGFPPDRQTGRSFLATHSEHQAMINATQWRIRRGIPLHVDRDVFPVSTGELRCIGGNDSICIGPDVFTQRSAIWALDPTVPGNEATMGAGGDDGDLGREKQAKCRLTFEANKARGWRQVLRDWRGRWRGKKVIVLGNGPSLADNAKALRKFRDVVILGVNRATDYCDPALLDALVLIDYLIDKTHFFFPERVKTVPLLFADTIANPAFVDFIGRDKAVWFSPRIVPPGREWQTTVRDETGWIPMEMSVLNAAANIAYYAGAESVIFMGADHCYHPMGAPMPWPVPRIAHRQSFSVRCSVCGVDTAAAHSGPLKVEGHDAVLHDAETGIGQVCLRYPGKPQHFNPEVFACWDMAGNAVLADALVELPARQLCAWATFQRRAAHEGRAFSRCLNATGRGMMFDTWPNGGMMQVDFQSYADEFLEAA